MRKFNQLFNNLAPLFNEIAKEETPKEHEFEKEDVTIDPAIVIETLERRVVELENEVKGLKDDDSRRWCFDTRQPHWLCFGITIDNYRELEKVAKHYNTKTGSNLTHMMALCWQAPIPQREKLVLFFLCMFYMKAE